MKRKVFVAAFFMVLASAAPFALSASGGSAAVTFSKDVAPIFFKNCGACHRPGEVAPMSLLTYKEARPWARSIKEKVVSGVMPPWHADPHYGEFSNDRRLVKRDIDTIVAWVDGGAKEGDPKDLPPLPRFAEGWQIGKPDVVLTMGEEFNVPSEGTINYKYFVIPTGFKEDRWIQAAEIRPGNRLVVHHVIAFVVDPSAIREGLSGRNRIDGLAGYAPGTAATILPDGVGRLIKAGSLVVLQMHYTTNGTAQKDRTSIGLVFCKRPVEKASMGGAAMNRWFTIPAGDGNFEVRSTYRFKDDSHIISLMPHMHLRGKDFEYRIVYPDGTSKVILSVPHYDFNWQTRYDLKEPIAAPKGSRLDCIAHFDNSTANKWNPDPTKNVRWGQQTWDEMMIGFVGFTLDNQVVQPVANR
jgi:mono/diheme cytochrome c family protein